jgi:hypothetical protein
VKANGKKYRQFQFFLLPGENIQYQGGFGVLIVGVGMDIDVVQGDVDYWL